MAVVTQQWTFTRFQKYYRLVDRICRGDRLLAYRLACEADKRLHSRSKPNRNKPQRLETFFSSRLIRDLFYLYSRFRYMRYEAWQEFKACLFWVNQQWKWVSASQAQLLAG